MKRIFTVITLILFLIGLVSCLKKKEESKNMEQIHQEEGVPVRVKTIVPRAFVQELSYNATLTGIEESTIKSMVSDVIQSVNAKVGDYVQKDQVIITFPRTTPTAQYEQALSAFNNAKSTYERMQRLFSKGAISQQDMDNVTTAYNVAKANLNAVDQIVNVKAPISGYITAMNVMPSDKVDHGTELFTISNMSKYKAVLWIPETEIQNVKKGQKAIATFGDVTLNGTVSSLGMTLDGRMKAFRADVVFAPNGKKLATGVTVDIKIEVSRINNALVVERKDIVEQDNIKYVWLAVDNKAIKRQIETKHENGLEFEVVKGLTAGDKIITEGIPLLSENCLIRIVD